MVESLRFNVSALKKRRVSGSQVIKFIEYMKNYSSQNEFYEGWLIFSIGFTPAAIAEAEKEMNVKISLGTVRSNKIDWDYSNADNFTNSRNTSNSDNSNPLFEKLDKCCYIGVFAKEPLNKSIKIDHRRCWIVMSGIYPLKRTNRRQMWC